MKRLLDANRELLFFTVAFIVVIVNTINVRYFGEKLGSFSEIAILADFAIFLPLLYILFFRYELKKALVKSLGIACIGFWGASVLVPGIQQDILLDYGFIRYVGLSVLVFIEVKVTFVIWKAVFSGKDRDQILKEAKDRADMPEWVARLMVWEASFWKKLGRAIGIGKKRK
ncbi:hypothetical protein [uncultured Microbulbifer sp.]|uniref:hypothetical protein n=1 Tax=uncultured Microbulbifer sp. TaxID=348147 RepID=UPI00261CEADF|nr:hypothetical protein [uncultured Microbulbifer sp.]